MKRLFNQFQPENYSLSLDLNPESKKFTGKVTITGKKVGPPSSRLTLHQHGLKIKSVKLLRHDKKGAQEFIIDRINHHAAYDEVRLHSSETLYPGTYVIDLEFEGRIQETMHGIYLSTYKDGEQTGTVISTQFESHHAREALPCIDEPEAKATFDLSLLTPPGNAVIGNMPVNAQTETNGRLMTTFGTSPKMSSYLLAFVCGDLQHKETKTKDGVAVRVWSTKVHSDKALDYALDVIKNGIEFFNEYYGVPYPLEKCDNVAIPDFSSGAMENWGLITYRETVLLADPKTASSHNREAIALVCLHELSHQWFGNLVTMKWWDDLWLNESFANVMEYVAADALFPKWHIWDSFTGNEGLAAFRRDSIAGVQAVKTTVKHPDEISTLFDPSIVYAKGGRLLNMLMNYLGEDDFRKGLKDYFTKHAYGNTTGDDLWAALGKASGKDVRAFMNPWLNNPGFPVVEVQQTGKDIKLTQSHFLLDMKKIDKSRHWPVPLLSDNPKVPSLLPSKADELQIPKNDYIRINLGAIGHYIVNYSEPEHRKYVYELASNKKLSEAEKLILLSDSSLMARAGIVSFGDTLELLEYYREEDSEPVWDMISLILADLRRFIDSDPALEDKIKALIRELIAKQFNRLGWEQKTDEPVQDTKLRSTIIGLGVYAEHNEITKRALDIFEAYKKNDSVVTAELRSIVFGAAIRNHQKGAFKYLLKLDESTGNVNLKQDLLSALTTTRQSEEATILLSRLKDSKKVRLHDVDHWLVNLMRNRHTQALAWDWLRDNWQWIEKTFSGDKSYDYFPRYAAGALNTRIRLDEYMKFFEKYKDHAALGRNVVMGIEELSTRIAWLEKDIPTVKKYLAKY